MYPMGNFRILSWVSLVSFSLAQFVLKFFMHSYSPNNTHFASATLSLDTYVVRVQSVLPGLSTSFTLPKGSRVTGLSWFSYGEQDTLALNLSRGATMIYSPAANEVVAELDTGSNSAVLDFHFSSHTNTAWSCDASGTIYEWDAMSWQRMRQVRFSDAHEDAGPPQRLSSVSVDGKPHLLVGTHAVHMLDEKLQEIRVFPGHAAPVTALVPVGDGFLTAAKGDRFVNWYGDKGGKGVFVASGAVTQVDAHKTSEDTSILCVLTENGTVEVFNGLNAPVSSKKRRKALQSRSPSASISVTRPENQISGPSDALTLCAVAVDASSVHIAWNESTAAAFDSLSWVEGKNYVLEGDRILTKARPIQPLGQNTSEGHDIAAPKAYSELHTVIRQGTNVNDDEDEREEEEEREEEGKEERKEDETEEQENVDREEPTNDSAEETLAEKLSRLPVETSRPQKLTVKGTLTTVLTQALRTHDSALLESVLGNRDPHVVEHTVSRLDPSLAVGLLDHIAERLQRQASKFDQLKVWLRWVIVIHGTVLASVPDLANRLYSLHAVLARRAAALPRLLELRGRMDMLYDYAEVRGELVEENEDEDDVEYVEELDGVELGSHDENDFDEDENDFDEDEMELDEVASVMDF